MLMIGNHTYWIVCFLLNAGDCAGEGLRWPNDFFCTFGFLSVAGLSSFDSEFEWHQMWCVALIRRKGLGFKVIRQYGIIAALVVHKSKWSKKDWKSYGVNWLLPLAAGDGERLRRVIVLYILVSYQFQRWVCLPLNSYVNFQMWYLALISRKGSGFKVIKAIWNDFCSVRP